MTERERLIELLEKADKMREILFRAKNADPYNAKEWRFGYYQRTENIYYYINEENGSLIPINPKTLGEYTGIKDENRVRIFEGDILRADNGHIGYVVFRNGSFVKKCSCHNSVSTFYGDNETIIGNIYDNPELLEEVK